MKVQLNWKESSYSKLPELHIAASEIVSDETFEQMQAHPLWDHDVIQKHIQDMRSVAGGEYCLLIAPENGTDGLLVRSEGSSCARYSAYIPGGRLMTLVTPELERALRRCETAAKEAVRRECVQTLTGKWTCSLAELDAAFGAGLQENKILAELFCDKLARQAEVASAYLEGDMLRVGFRPEYCPRLENRGRIRVLRAEPGGPVRELQIENRLEAFQKSVRGNIECVGLKDGAVLICEGAASQPQVGRRSDRRDVSHRGRGCGGRFLLTYGNAGGTLEKGTGRADQEHREPGAAEGPFANWSAGQYISCAPGRRYWSTSCRRPAAGCAAGKNPDSMERCSGRAGMLDQTGRIWAGDSPGRCGSAACL